MITTRTIRAALKQASTHVDLLDAELLLAHVLLQSREFLIAHDDDSLGLMISRKYKKLVRKRAKGFSVARLVGHKAFYGLEFEVNKHTLVPRPDTELMVEIAIAKIKESKINDLVLVDVGAGSGCVPISIAHEIKKQSSDFNLKSFATDISKPALKVARRNAKKHATNITFLQGNLLEPIYSQFRIPHSQFIITANLPYLTEEQFESEPSIQHEPKSALVADMNGLALYDELLEQLKQWPKVTASCFFEIDPTQSENITTMIHKYFPDTTVTMHEDLCGRDRIVSFELDSK